MVYPNAWEMPKRKWQSLIIDGRGSYARDVQELELTRKNSSDVITLHRVSLLDR